MAKVPGSIWIEGIDLHYVDAYGREWYCPGRGIKAQNAKPGSLWLDNVDAFLKHTDESGTIIVYPQPHGYLFIPRVKDSIWVNGNFLNWTVFLPASGQSLKVIAHYDIAANISHDDAHADASHGDAHTDVAHTDLHDDFAHVDYHDDSPHQDYHVDYHDDTHQDVLAPDHADHQSVLVHNDAGMGNSRYVYHTDAYSQPANAQHWDTTQGFASDSTGGAGLHYDHFLGYNSHTDSHTDYHDDQFQDYPHHDYSDYQGHVDNHVDSPHQDAAHVDVAHVDGHGDSHNDTPHQDEPILIGP